VNINFPTANITKQLLLSMLASVCEFGPSSGLGFFITKVHKEFLFRHFGKFKNLSTTYPDLSRPVQTYPDISRHIQPYIHDLSSAPIRRQYLTYPTPIHSTLKTYPALDLIANASMRCPHTSSLLVIA
jgi:hypothetical protein